MYKNPFADFAELFDIKYHAHVSQPVESVETTKDNFTITLEVPGFAESDIDVHIKGRTLNILADHKDNGKYLTKTVTRSWLLPPDVAVDQITSTLKLGVLTVVVPKKTPLTTKVQVKVLGQ